MKNRPLIVAFLIAAALAAVVDLPARAARSRNPGESSPATDPKVQTLVARRDALEPSIGGYPPRFKDGAQANAVSKEISEVLAGLIQLSERSPADARIQYELGIAYAMADNAGLVGARANAEKNLKRAIELAPNRSEAHVELGRLYVNSRPPLAQKAEEEFNAGLRLSGPRPNASIFNGLLFANYYQGKLDQAIAAGEVSVKMEPENRAFKNALDVVKKKRNEGEKNEEKKQTGK